MFFIKQNNCSQQWLLSDADISKLVYGCQITFSLYGMTQYIERRGRVINTPSYFQKFPVQISAPATGYPV
jgi:hypothetical protein